MGFSRGVLYLVADAARGQVHLPISCHLLFFYGMVIWKQRIQESYPTPRICDPKNAMVRAPLAVAETSISRAVAGKSAAKETCLYRPH
jgi:hypothetical protein